MEKTIAAALVWFRRDLRATDHAALHHACRAAKHVWCAFVFDRAILDPLPRNDRRVEFIRESLVELDADLRSLAESHGVAGAGLLVRHGDAVEEIASLASALGVQEVYANHDDEPGALARDAKVRGRLADAGIALRLGKDHLIFERDEVLSAAGTPYSIFTPYRHAWMAKLEPFHLREYPVARHAAALAPLPGGIGAGIPALADLGFEPTNLREIGIGAGCAAAAALFDDFGERIDRYGEARDFPAVKGPSYLGVHMRFGTISPRFVAREAHRRLEAGSPGAAIFLSEIVWRDFFQQVMHHHPRVVGHPFRPEYEALKWSHGRDADAHFAAWREGRTGVPIVDAAMRQINQTGYMHNRLRMIAASYLIKDLGIDWRLGEAYFAERLNDFELASNNGNWQWVASTGSDAQPPFRIFDPVSQSRRFDAEGRFIRRYVPELDKLPDALIHAPWEARPIELSAAGVDLDRDYPRPLVDHREARQLALQRYDDARRAAPARAARKPARRAGS